VYQQIVIKVGRGKGEKKSERRNSFIPSRVAETKIKAESKWKA
jgi:hypothetical protein